MHVQKPYSRLVLSEIAALKTTIDDQPTKFKRVEELLATLSTVNRSLLERAFKDVYRCGLKEYLVKRRLEQAKEYLEMGISKKMVADKCNYRSQSAFSTAFRRSFGMTPTEWQRMSG